MPLYMSSVTGHFVDAAHHAANPDTTFEVKRVTPKELRKEIAQLKEEIAQLKEEIAMLRQHLLNAADELPILLG